MQLKDLCVVIIRQYKTLSNMYTELGHEDIERAVMWEARLPGRRRTSDRVAIHRRRREAHLGRGYGAGWLEVRTEDILDVSAFDNRNLFVRVRGKVIRQCHGCPMGSNLSPSKAVICCSPIECDFLRKLRALEYWTV